MNTNCRRQCWIPTTENERGIPSGKLENHFSKNDPSKFGLPASPFQTPPSPRGSTKQPWKLSSCIARQSFDAKLKAKSRGRAVELFQKRTLQFYTILHQFQMPLLLHLDWQLGAHCSRTSLLQFGRLSEAGQIIQWAGSTNTMQPTVPRETSHRNSQICPRPTNYFNNFAILWRTNLVSIQSTNASFSLKTSRNICALRARYSREPCSSQSYRLTARAIGKYR